MRWFHIQKGPDDVMEPKCGLFVYRDPVGGEWQYSLVLRAVGFQRNYFFSDYNRALSTARSQYWVFIRLLIWRKNFGRSRKGGHRWFFARGRSAYQPSVVPIIRDSPRDLLRANKNVG